MAYLLAVWTGLRRRELRRLLWSDLHLDAIVPHIRLRAEVTKSRRADVVPLHRQLVDALREYRSCTPDAHGRVLPEVPSMGVLRKDLAAAGIEYGNRDIGYADLHAQRKTLNLLLAAQGVSGRTRQAQLRHTDPRLTENTYFDAAVFLLPQSQEISTVPAIVLTGRPERPVAPSPDAGLQIAEGPTQTPAEKCAPLMHQGSGSNGQIAARGGNPQAVGTAHHADPLAATNTHFLGDPGIIKRHDPASFDTGSLLKRAKGVEPSTFTLATCRGRRSGAIKNTVLHYKIGAYCTTIRATLALKLVGNRTSSMVHHVAAGSLLQIATDLLNFDESRTRKDGAARTRGTIHPRVRLNRRKMLLDFLEFMNGRYGQGCLKRMMLADLAMADVEAYNQKIALAGYSQSQVSERLQTIHALIERAGRPQFGHQLLGWNWESRDVSHGKPPGEMRLLTLPQLKRLHGACELREQTMLWMGIGLGFGPSDLAAVRVGQIDKRP